MEARSFYWQTADHTEIYGCEWPVAAPRGVLVLAHGLGEHIHRYAHFAHWFNEHGFAVLGYDRRGHGRSAGRRGHSPGLEPLRDEIAHLLVEAQTAYQELPVFLYGHSQGGGLVLSYTLRRNPDLAGVIASAPWIKLAFQPPKVLVALGQLMRNIYPRLQQSNNLDPKLLSQDEEVVQAYERDPLVHDRISAAVGIDMMKEGAWLASQKTAFPCPLLLMHGDQDGVTSHEASRELAGRLKGDVSFHSFPGLFHELHNEPAQTDVFETVLQWMEERAARTA